MNNIHVDKQYSCSLSFPGATLKLSNDTHLVLNRFRVNSMVANRGKCSDYVSWVKY